MVLNVIARPGDAFAAMRDLIRANDARRGRSARQVRAAIRAYRALLAAGVIERIDEPDEQGRTVRLAADLPLNFALNQPLSTFALAALDLLDPESETYALDVVSVLESTLDDPRQVLSAQQYKARGEAVAAMKADGHRVRGAHGAARRRHASEATGRAARRGVRDLPAEPSVALRGPAVAQVGRARHVGTGDDVHRVRRVLRADPQRGTGAALPDRRLPRAALERARRRADRGGGRHHRVARHAGPPGRLQPARRVGAADRGHRRRRGAEAGRRRRR